ILEHIDFTQSTRDIVVYWGGRRPADLYLHDWMMALAERLPNVRYIPVVSDATADDNWTGRTGFVHAAALADIADMSGMQAYVCGAPIVVDAAKRDFVSERGLPEEAFFADSFTSAADTAQN
ncbi:MAG: CDP-6-deoxy-delta-3,4-glucoseen reductase, partial [Burkholderiaceae bacterium]|nr:CDP-6-deoxy-delta-3,4-glucoseen reductase [Burkholderiaceae bacterium]